MIYLYNEYNTAKWEVVKKNDHFFRLQLIDSPVFGINIRADEDIREDSFKQDALNATNDVYNANLLLALPTSVRFDNRSLRPSIRKADDKYNSDIYVVSYDITSGDRIINALTKKAFVYDYLYDYDKEQLHVIFSLNNRQDNTFMELIFMDKAGKNVILRHFMNQTKYQNKPCMISKSMSLDNSIKRGERGYINPTDYAKGSTEFMIRKYVPLRPTKLVITQTDAEIETAKNLIHDNFHFDPSTLEIVSMEGKEENLREEMRKFVYDQSLSCVTFFVSDHDKEDLKKNKEAKDDLLENKFGKLFTNVLALCNDGWIIRVK